MKHVTVNADQAVVAATVVGGSKVPTEIFNEGNNAPLLLEARHAPGLALQGASKRTGKPYQSPAVNGWAVCRMHGARGGARKGEANGTYKTGEHG